MRPRLNDGGDELIRALLETLAVFERDWPGTVTYQNDQDDDDLLISRLQALRSQWRMPQDAELLAMLGAEVRGTSALYNEGGQSFPWIISIARGCMSQMSVAAASNRFPIAIGLCLSCLLSIVRGRHFNAILLSPEEAICSCSCLL